MNRMHSRSVNLPALQRAAWLVAGLALMASVASAQTTDSTTERPATKEVRKLETITVTSERPKAAAPPVTTIEVPASELRRTFSTDAYDLLRRTTGI